MPHRILLVEDEEPVLNAIADKLRRLKFEVHCAADKEEAEALLATYDYALVLSDLFLPPENVPGLALIADATSAPYSPKLVALTAHRTSEMERRARQHGAEAFVPKPVSLNELGMLVQALLNDRDTRPAARRIVRPAPLWNRLMAPGGIRTHIQPIFEARKGQVLAVECLARGPRQTPFERADALFAYARRKHAEPVLDRRCLQLSIEACRFIPMDVRIALNAHACTLATNPDLPDWLVRVARKNGIEPSRLTVEIVEHSPAWNHAAFLRALASLRQHGMRIALDDIGLGNANFHMILETRPDYFKIDRYLVKGAAEDLRRRAVIGAVSKLAREFGAAAIAEGVDNEADLAVVIECGIEVVQGFLFCRPFLVQGEATVSTGALEGATTPAPRTCPLASMHVCIDDPERSQCSLCNGSRVESSPGGGSFAPLRISVAGSDAR